MDLSGLLALIDETAGLGRLTGRLAPDRPARVGVSDGAKATTVAALALRLGRPVLVVVSRPNRAATLRDELEAWLGERGCALLFPERDDLPYERIAPDPADVRARLAALEALASPAGPLVVVASGLALSQRTLTPAERRSASVDVAPGDRRSPDDLLRAAVAMGYRREPQVLEPGTVSRRGSIVDLWPPAEGEPARVDFWGDEVDSVRRFDPATQRSLGRVGSVRIGPAIEALDWPAAVASLDKADVSAMTPAARAEFEEVVASLARGEAHAGGERLMSFLCAGTLLDHLGPDAILVVEEPSEVEAAMRDFEEHAEEERAGLERRGELPRGMPQPYVPWEGLAISLARHPLRLTVTRWAAGEEDGAVRLPFGPAEVFGGRLRALANTLAAAVTEGRRVLLVSTQAPRLWTVLREFDVPAVRAEALTQPPEPGSVAVLQGALPRGWSIGFEGEPVLELLTDAEIFGFSKVRRPRPRQRGVALEAFLAALRPGDYVVHVDHGVARFSGLVHRVVGGVEREYLELQFAEGDRLFVPTDQVDRVSRYVGSGDRAPSLTRLGSQEWSRARARVRRAVQDLAKELLELYAAREALPGRAFPPDTPWQQELEASFPYVETPDQMAALREVKQDMERPRPMDRLVCGDVGYGKTEVAVRAAFKAVAAGAQVAVLVPTTVLAQQHVQTFQRRLAPFPARVEMLSRFRSDREQRAIVQGLADSSIDIVIGTHRLLQKDVRFKNLGLVVIDEEQRFGVAHKERLKQMRREVDVLTLTATPIPRTLHMAVSGIRDMSTIETPPEDRLPIKTYVTEFDDQLVREAVIRELERGGQVYFVHNRVHNIEQVARKVRDLVPEAEVIVAHGQMPEEQLERAMLRFVAGEADVLVCTTIIESGLDIPNVNTIIINQADRLGLSQLYQLRGRVGRGAVRAYAYLLYDRGRALSEVAQKRLQAIFEATELGAGFQIAMRDLEIRGAGNLLGAEQSGHIGAVGFDLYVRMLAEAVRRLQALQAGRAPEPAEAQRPAVTLDLPVSAFIPETYVPDLNVRLSVYQRMGEVRTPEEARALADELRDRFGPPPRPVRELVYVLTVRALARQAGATAVQMEDGALVLRMEEGADLRASGVASAPGVAVGRRQARLDVHALGDRWRDALVALLERIASARPTAA